MFWLKEAIRLFSNLNNSEKKTGFTIVEVLICTAILIVVLALVLASYPKFSETVNLRQAVQVLASDIRRAQIYGISVKENPIGSWVFPVYGLHFDFTDTSLGQKSYILFADMDGDNLYDVSPIDEKISQSTVSSPGYIFRICTNQKTGATANCPNSCDGSITGVNIIFKRPVPDIFLYPTGSINACEDVELIVKSPKGAQNTVVLWKSGQIAVENN